jgi:hypothetical protein
MPKYVLNSFLAGILSVTFTLSPYAEAADNSGAITQIKTKLKESKMATTKSFPEFFARMAQQSPSEANPQVFRQLAGSLQDEEFPKMQMQEFKYKGKDAIRVVNTIGGKQVVVEYIFQGSEVLKIDGMTFTQTDLASNEAFEAKLKTVPAFQKIYIDYQKRVFAKSTTPTYAQWKKMSKFERAEYYMRYRQLLEAAYKVHNTPTFKVVNHQYKSFDEWMQTAFLGNDAEAASAPGAAVSTIGNKGASTNVIAPANAETPGAAPAKPPGSTTVDGSAAKQEAVAVEKAKLLTASMGNPKPFVGAGEDRGPSCIVAGHARQWVGESCPWNGGTAKGTKDFYEENPSSKECLKPSAKGNDGGKGWIACNPLVYGFNETGRVHCINTAVKSGPDNFNFATHGSGPCERHSPLNTAEQKMTFIKNILNKEKIPGAENLKVVDGQLVTDKPELFDKIFKELQKPISDYIESAQKICEKSAAGKYNYKMLNKPPIGKKGPKKDSAYQDEACDALMKRAISVQSLLTLDKPPTTTIAKVCEGWKPEDRVEEVTAPDGKKACACKNKEDKLEGTQCIAKADPGTPAPPPTTPSEPVVDTPSRTIADVDDCDSYWTRMAPGNECKSSFGDKALLFGGIVAGICISNAVFKTNILGICRSKKKDLKDPVHVDPVPPCDIATGCPKPVDPVDPVDPVQPPRVGEETTNQNNPTINPIQIPPR